MTGNKLKKPGRVGGKKSFMGVILALVALLIPFMVAFGLQGGLPMLLKKIIIFGQMNPVFAFLLLIAALFGGMGLGTLMKGGTSLGSTTQVSELDKL
jgi:ABC-type microcin C transport system permease subunit YejE